MKQAELASRQRVEGQRATGLGRGGNELRRGNEKALGKTPGGASQGRGNFGKGEETGFDDRFSNSLKKIHQPRRFGLTF